MVSEFARFRASTASFTGLNDWNFQLTAGLVGTRSSETFFGLTHLSKDVDIWDTLQSIRAVAVLGHLGYGLKTTIVDAIAAGCHVILSPTMWDRLPIDLRPYCVVWNSRKPESIEEIATRIEQEPPNDGKFENARRRKRAMDVAMSLVD
jgi:hypothetical protein